MTLPRLEAMLDYWEDQPPTARALADVRAMLKGFFGIKESKSKESRKQTEEEFNQAIREFGQKTGLC